MLYVMLSVVAAMHDASTTRLGNTINGSRVPQLSDSSYAYISRLPVNITANRDTFPFQKGRAGPFDLLSGVNRATNSCNPVPPANCSGHGILSGCMCVCNTGYANDFSVSVERQPYIDHTYIQLIIGTLQP